MSSPLIQILVLAGIAVFLILRLRNVLGTRDGFEPPKPAEQLPAPHPAPRPEVIEGTAVEGDRDIADHVDTDSPAGKALAAMKKVEPGFSVSSFLGGARQAYEMILMAFEHGDLSQVQSFLAPQVAEAFQTVIAGRQERGETVEAQYLGTHETTLAAAQFDADSAAAEISVRFVAETVTAVKDASGKVIDGDPKAPRKQRDTWTFARKMGSSDPNWQLVATG